MALPRAPRKTAVVTGASSGIGEASARALAAAGWHVVVGARRADRIEALAAEIDGTAMVLDVTDQTSVDTFCAAIDRCDLLVNNAGGAKGLERVADARIDDWTWMYETNVLGTVRMTKALLPALVASGDGMVITIGSIAGREAYPGGAGYNAAKFGQAALSQVLRLELVGQPVRICEIDPGLVETEFSLVRFDGDVDKAAAPYRGMTPLTAQDIADAVEWIASRPAHVNIDQLRIQPRDQAAATIVHRGEA